MTEAPKAEAPKTVSEIMSATLLVLREEDNLRSVLDGMQRFRIRHLPVVDGDQLVGIVSHRDVLAAMHSSVEPRPGDEERERELEDRTFVATVMTRAPIVVGPSTPVGHAVRLIVRHRIGALPVVERGKLLGIVTETDLLQVLEKLLPPGDPLD